MKLTPEQIEETGEAVKAWMRGEPAQYFNTGAQQWRDIISHLDKEVPLTVTLLSQFRLKPKPKLRPWTAEEVPLGRFFKRKSDGWIFSVCCFRDDNIVLGNCGAITLSKLCDDYTHSDSGKAWLPCGVMEESK